MKFRWKKKNEREAPGWVVSAVARERAFRRRMANRLQARAGRMSPAQLRWSAFGFLLLGSLVYTWILVRAVNGKGKEPAYQVITVPVTVGRGAKGATNVVRPSFRVWMDSVNADASLKRRFDSLRAARPGFADTIRRLEEMFPEH